MLVTYKDKGRAKGRSKKLRTALLRQHTRGEGGKLLEPRERVANFLNRQGGAVEPMPTRVSLGAASAASSSSSESALSACSSSSTGHDACSLPPSASQFDDDDSQALRAYRRQSKKQKRRQQQERHQCEAEGYAADVRVVSSEVLGTHRAAMVSPRAPPARVPGSAAGSGGAAAVLPTPRLKELATSDMSWTVLSYPVAAREEPGPGLARPGKDGVEHGTAEHEHKRSRAPLGESRPKPHRNLKERVPKSTVGAAKKRRRQSQAWAGPKLTVRWS